MHDPTEGGVATGLLEMATASRVGLEVLTGELQISEDSLKLCQAFDLNPFGVISSGALLIGCAPGSTEAITTALREAC
jgi:hydrogenase expression/formation protein HypE